MSITNYSLTPIGSSQFQDTANTNSAVVIKSSSGTLYSIDIDNTSLASVVYSKFYDSAGAVVVGTTAPDWVVRVPASTRISFQLVAGHAFANGLQVATVTAGGTAGTTAPATPPTIRVIYT
jgi:hypothetical protein